MTSKLILLLAFLATGTLVGPEAKVTQVLSKDLPDIPGKEGLMLMVEYPPGSSDPVHRHNAYTFVYVLEGSIIEQVRGGKEMTLGPGQTFYEGSDKEVGLACVQALHELDPSLLIVVLTGFVSIATAVEAIKLGARHYLAKPSNSDDIEAAFAKSAGDAASPIDRGFRLLAPPSPARARRRRTP